MNVFIVGSSESPESSRRCLQSILSDIPDISVIGRVEANGPGAIERIVAQMPDAVIFDIDLKNMAVDGMLENVKRRCPGVRVMVLADCTNGLDFNRCLHTGEDNFFDKTSQFMTIRAALWKWVYDCRLGRSFDALCP